MTAPAPLALPADVLRLASSAALATVCTLMPDGQPQAQTTWVDTDGEHILINTQPMRQRTKNIGRDPRITVLIYSATDPWDWAEVRGVVLDSYGGPAALDHLDQLAHRYLGREYRNPIGPLGRIVLRIGARKINLPSTVAKIPGPAVDPGPG